MTPSPIWALLRHLVPREARRAASAHLARRSSARLHHDLAGLASTPAPIVAGPWLGEVGFELLYWVPFLAWFAERFDVPPERLIVLSRGGTASWYGPFTGRYVEVFDCVTPEEFREQHDARVRETGEQKQTRTNDFEEQLAEQAARGLRLEGWSHLHPSRMYNVLNPYWWGHVPDDWVHRHARYRRLPMPCAEGVPVLPQSYIAVKFYFNECFPPSDQNRAFVHRVLDALTTRGPVVALSTGLRIDDHGGCHISHGGVQHLPEGIEPARNLHVQSHVVARARAFVGTYGGFSYLAPFYGVPSVAYFSDAGGFSPRHLAMARSAFERIGAGGFLRACDVAGGPVPLADPGVRHA
jgi:hypothetical protein